MNRAMGWMSLLVVFSTGLTAGADDRPKAEKQTRKITAMATDKTGRQMVSMSVADTFKMPRPEMVRQRRHLALDYGSYFVAHELMDGGMNLAEIAAELKQGKTVWQIGEERRVDWKRIAADAKKQNSRIEDYIYRHFLNQKNLDADQDRDLADKYDIMQDAVRSDFSVSPAEMAEAQSRYIFWRTEAGRRGLANGSMSPNERMAAAMEHTTSRHDTSGGISAPAAGGIPH